MISPTYVILVLVLSVEAIICIDSRKQHQTGIRDHHESALDLFHRICLRMETGDSNLENKAINE